MLPRSYSQYTSIKKNINTFLLTCVFAFLIFCGASVFGIEVTHAQDTFGLEPVNDTVVLGNQDIRVTIARIIQVLLGLIGVVALSIVLYGGFLIMTSAGNEEKVARGRQTLLNGGIGLIIIFSAFAIVQYVINILSDATGARTTGTGTGQPSIITTFNGSGALGGIIDDHYPERNQTGVKRNTKVIVTFAEAIDPASIIEDTNNSGTLGDCVTASGAAFSWETDCDRLITDAVRIYPSDNSGALVEAAVMTTYEGAEQQARTFVFKPLSLLGSASNDVWYTTELTSQIQKVSGGSAFAGDRDGKYFWEFETDTTLDFDAPIVLGVSPIAFGQGSRNSIIQIRFNEPIDPITTQGVLSAQSNFKNIIFHDPTVTGEWRISNGYKTVEFVSDQPCGQNSCGEVMYCLPRFLCAPDDEQCLEPYQVLVRTADLITTSTFEALPFSGVTDIAGNALDGDKDGNPDGKPAMGDATYINGGEAIPDNFTWNFSIQNMIDRTSPYIEKVTPGIDQESVTGQTPVEILFSKPIWQSTLYNVNIHEYPQNVAGLPNLWVLPSAAVTTTGQVEKTFVRMKHRDFGPEGNSLYYFTEVPSEVRGLNQNCMYPGRGPVSQTKNTSPTCTYEVASDGTVIRNENCVGVTMVSSTDSGCIQTNNAGQVLTADTETCIEFLESISEPTQ